MGRRCYLHSDTTSLHDSVVPLNLDLGISSQLGCHPGDFYVISFNPIPLNEQFTCSLLKPLVNGSVIFSFDFMKLMEIIPLESNCLTILCLQRICRDLPLYIWLCALPIADLLSQCIQIEGTSFIHIANPSGNDEATLLPLLLCPMR